MAGLDPATQRLRVRAIERVSSRAEALGLPAVPVSGARSTRRANVAAGGLELTKLRILGWLYTGLSTLTLLIGSVICLGLLFETDPRGLPAFQFIFPLFLMLAVVLLVPALVGGVGLLTNRSWAKIPVIIASLVLLLLFPIGTALGAVALWVLYDDEKRSAAAAPSASAPATPTPRQSPGKLSAAATHELTNAGGVLVAMTGVGSGFIVVIGAGFRINNQQAPAPLDALFYPALVVLLVVVGYGLRRLFAGGTSDVRKLLTGSRLTWSKRHELTRQREAYAEERRRRIIALAENPATRKYATLMEKGEAWNDAQIAYDQDLNKTATCIHLTPIERAMREAALDVRLLTGANVKSPCLIDEPQLARKFAPLMPVRYIEFMSGERSIEDAPHAALTCAVCGSTISVLHRAEATLHTPLFPF